METMNGSPLPAMSTDVQWKRHNTVPPGLVLGKYLELALTLCWAPHACTPDPNSKKHVCILFFSAAECSIQALLISLCISCVCVPAAWTPRGKGFIRLFVQKILIHHTPPPVANDLLGQLFCINLVCRNTHTGEHEQMWYNDVYLSCASEPLNSKYRCMLVFSTHTVH